MAVQERERAIIRVYTTGSYILMR